MNGVNINNEKVWKSNNAHRKTNNRIRENEGENINDGDESVGEESSLAKMKAMTKAGEEYEEIEANDIEKRRNQQRKT